MSAQIISIQVGLPKSYGIEGAVDPMDRVWTSGVVKEPVARPVRVGKTNIEGDGQADLKNHGGTDKAVLAYSADHYPQWNSELGLPDLPYGAFGENLTVRGLAEPDVCIGDLWTVGDVVLQVSQPRQPCWKLGRRWRLAELPKRVVQTGRSGWYHRVLQEGMIQPGMAMRLVSRPHPQWSVARASEVLYAKSVEPAVLAELAALPELAEGWKSDLPGRPQDSAKD
jgi:MOSC domain-containing protein YiiM